MAQAEINAAVTFGAAAGGEDATHWGLWDSASGDYFIYGNINDTDTPPLLSGETFRYEADSITITTFGNEWSGAISDTTTIWFINNSANVAVAYTVSTRARDSAKDINLGNGDWQGAVL